MIKGKTQSLTLVSWAKTNVWYQLFEAKVQAHSASTVLFSVIVLLPVFTTGCQFMFNMFWPLSHFHWEGAVRSQLTRAILLRLFTLKTLCKLTSLMWILFRAVDNEPLYWGWGFDRNNNLHLGCMWSDPLQPLMGSFHLSPFAGVASMFCFSLSPFPVLSLFLSSSKWNCSLQRKECGVVWATSVGLCALGLGITEWFCSLQHFFSQLSLHSHARN